MHVHFVCTVENHTECSVALTVCYLLFQPHSSGNRHRGRRTAWTLQKPLTVQNWRNSDSRMILLLNCGEWLQMHDLGDSNELQVHGVYIYMEFMITAVNKWQLCVLYYINPCFKTRLFQYTMKVYFSKIQVSIWFIVNYVMTNCKYNNI